jgi:hypothetical protein
VLLELIILPYTSNYLYKYYNMSILLPLAKHPLSCLEPNCHSVLISHYSRTLVITHLLGIVRREGAKTEYEDGRYHGCGVGD